MATNSRKRARAALDAAYFIRNSDDRVILPSGPLEEDPLGITMANSIRYLHRYLSVQIGRGRIRMSEREAAELGMYLADVAWSASVVLGHDEPAMLGRDMDEEWLQRH